MQENILKTVREIFRFSDYLKFDKAMMYWRKKLCNMIFYTFSILGSILFFTLGLLMLLLLGPGGAGGYWLFATMMITALLLGNPGALAASAVSSLTMIVIYFLLRLEILDWQTTYNLGLTNWLVKSLNFIFLNTVVVIANAIFIRGFRTVLNEATETRNASIIGLAKLAEHRDTDTGAHLKRIQTYTVMLASELAEAPAYKGYIDRIYIEDLRLSSILHDIGKVGIQDAILLKPGKLSREEFEEIKKHPVMGYDVISEIEKNISGRSLYELGREIALYHHEKWDGTGYPEGLEGSAIPLSARIIALADVYDALTTGRPYKKAFTHDDSVMTIIRGCGSHFDPDIVDAFLNISDDFRDVSKKN